MAATLQRKLSGGILFVMITKVIVPKNYFVIISARMVMFWNEIRVWQKGLLEKGSFQKSPFSKDSRESKTLEFLEDPQVVGNKRESGHFVETLENLEISEILEIPPAKRPLS